MPLPMKKVDTIYTYSDYLSWDENVRIEIIDGVPYIHATPLRKHQEVSGEVFTQLANFLEKKPCKVYSAPFTVRLPLKSDDCEDDITSVLEPDISVICDSSKLDEKGCNGAPDFIVEILSPSTARNDRIVKFEKYQKAGVREYWLVDPDEKIVQVYILDSGTYMNPKSGIYSEDDTVYSHVLEGFSVDMKKVFPADEATAAPAKAPPSSNSTQASPYTAPPN